MLLSTVAPMAYRLNLLLLRQIHRWLGLIAAIQLLIWMGSGLFFSLIPIEEIRGTHLVEKAAVFRLGHVKLVSPSSLVSQHQELSTVNLNQVRIQQRLNTPIYIVNIVENWLVFNAETAEKLMPLTETEVISMVSNITNSPVRSVTWVTEVARGSEYREGELPAWKIELNGPEHANLWVGANSGQVKAVRTTRWRIYDFLWSLHIMDYTDRDNFNSWLLKGFSLLGIFTILSGVVLFILSLRKRRRL